ncbi:MAG: hypothetical protein ACFE8U_11190 [Candidatus Hermodarchaeota archaeon]
MVVNIAPTQSRMANELERIRFEFTESKVTVKFLQTFSGFSFENITIPPGSKGSRLEIPYFIAEILRNKSIIEDFNTDFSTSLQDLTGAVRREVRSGKLQPIHPFFNILVKENAFTEEDQASQFDEVEIKRKTSKFNQLVHERVAKIVKMADSRGEFPRKSNLTAYERLLLTELKEIVHSWKTEIIEKMNEGSK